MRGLFRTLVGTVAWCLAGQTAPSNPEVTISHIPSRGSTIVRPGGTQAPAGFSVRVVSASPDSSYSQMLMPQAEGWLGSDAAYSIPLSATKSLWLFGDTFIGRVDSGRRHTSGPFAHNTIGIQDRSATPTGCMRFYWGRNNTAFFRGTPDIPGTYLWPTMGTMLDGQLVILCYSVNPDPNGWFSIAGTTLIRVTNPLEAPSEWKTTYSDLGIGGSHLGFHSAILVEEPYLYLLGYEDRIRDGRVAVLARVRTEDILAGRGSETFEFWANGFLGPEWSDKPWDLVPLFSPGNTETGIAHVPEWGLYFVTTYGNDSHRIYLTTATALTGPWAEPVCVYDVPERNSVSFPTVAYAARPHPELSTRTGEIVLTYATNAAGSIDPLYTQEGLSIYYPRFVRMRLEMDEPADDHTMY